MFERLIRASIFVLVISVLTTRSAWAGQYIDPNTGGMLFQMLAVAFGIMSGLLLVFYGRIKMWIARIGRYVREKREAKGKTANQK